MNPELSLLLSFINDSISVPLSKYLGALKENDYKKFKETFIKICHTLYSFSCDINFICEVNE